MINAMINIPEKANQILNIVKARYNLKTKSEAISMIVLEHGNDILEPKIRPEYIAKLRRIKKEGYSEKINNSAEELRIEIEKM